MTATATPSAGVDRYTLTPYLTVATLTNAAQPLTRDGQAMHRTVCYLTDGIDAPMKPRWCLPTPERLLIQHVHPVDFTPLKGLFVDVHSSPMTVHHPVGTHVTLTAIASCAKSVNRHDERGKPGRTRRVNRTPDELDSWIRERLADSLTIDTVDHEELPTMHIHRRTGTFAHQRVAFTVTGTVTDTNNLATHLFHGIGRGKAYGAGIAIAQATT